MSFDINGKKITVEKIIKFRLQNGQNIVIGAIRNGWRASTTLGSLRRSWWLHGGSNSMGNFSKWEHPLKAIVYAHRIKWQGKKLSGYWKRQAENSLWRIVQVVAYLDIMVNKLQSNETLKKLIGETSQIYQLSPYIDDLGELLRDVRIESVPYLPWSNFKLLLMGHV